MRLSKQRLRKSNSVTLSAIQADLAKSPAGRGFFTSIEIRGIRLHGYLLACCKLVVIPLRAQFHPNPRHSSPTQPMQYTPLLSILKRLFFLLAALSLFIFAQLASAQTMVSIDRNTVNMRASASTNATILFELGKGYPLEVISRKGNWLQVRDFESDKGWIYRPLVGKTAHLVVKVDVANVRNAPSTSSRILGKVEYGELLRTLDRRSQWVRVQMESGAKGWVSRALLWGW